ncbi:MAG: hypothetical protein ACTSU2_04780 [Promethearchaeota archaeon]
MEEEPKILKVIEENGEIDDVLDYIVNNRLLKERGMGFTACQPQLVEIDLNGKPTKAIKMGIDHTYVDEDGQVMGYGIIGHIYLSLSEDPNNVEFYYITPKEELEEKIKYIMENDIEPTPRPSSKY